MHLTSAKRSADLWKKILIKVFDCNFFIFLYNRKKIWTRLKVRYFCVPSSFAQEWHLYGMEMTCEDQILTKISMGELEIIEPVNLGG